MSRASVRIVVVALVVGVLAPGMDRASVRAAAPKFFDDDPLWLAPDSQDASNVQPWTIDLVVDLAFNMFGHPGDPARGVRARNVNTVDEVPDSSWFTNRAGRVRLTAADLARGPNTTNGPAPGTWTVTSAKSDGVTPGFTIRDSTGQIWFLKFDPPGYRGMATGTEAAVTKLMWALGYHVPENHISRLRLEQLVVGDSAHVTPPGGKQRAMRISDIAALLKLADREPDGSYRIIASRALEGKPLGGLRFYGTRPDDPNDVVPHEHRRELRGYGVYAAWLNHVDAKAINSLDTLVRAGGRSFVRHHLIDFGSALGSGGVYPREYWEGEEYLLERREILKGLPSFGFYIPRWRTMTFYQSPAIGRLRRDNASFDPDAWRPRVPNPAFVRARGDDKFWAARKLMTLDDEMIHAAVKSGEFGDPEAEAFLAGALIERRDAIGRKYLTAINPVVDPALDASGRLTFRNAAVDTGFAKPPAGYAATWMTFDNATGESRRIDEVSSTGTETRMPASAASTRDARFLRVQIRASGGPAAWAAPIDVYFRRTGTEWTLVGLERLP
jgi:hypothetical protein